MPIDGEKFCSMAFYFLHMDISYHEEYIGGKNSTTEH
jgi:hypothetical protein